MLQALAQQGQAAAQTSIDALLKTFKVHVDPRFGTWGLTPNGQGQHVYEVTPPTAPKPSTEREAPRPSADHVAGRSATATP